MAYVRYRLYFWNPPILTADQEIDAGRKIVMSGGPEALKKRALYLPPEERPTEGDEKSSPMRMTISIIILLGFLLLIVSAGPILWIPLGIVSVTVLPLSIYTLKTARSRYHDWIDKVVDAYLIDAERAIGISRLSDEEHMRAHQAGRSPQSR
jgi:hypothetical protein